MNKSFWIVLVVLILVCCYVPILGSIIRTFGVLIFLFHLSSMISNLIAHSSYSPKRFISPINRLILITGCDSGFGLALAILLDRYGFYVLAGVLSNDSPGCKHLDTNASKRLRTIKLDITNQADIDRLTDLIAHLTNHRKIARKLNQKSVFGSQDGKLKLWCLVNNAGVAQFTPIEFGTIEKDLLPMFNVNVFGMMRLTKSLLPFLRQSQGRIVNLGSVCDSLTIANMTGYSMSKHAIKSLTDGLRQELNRFKIKSILIQPTLYKTPISNIDQLTDRFHQCYERTDERIKLDYGDDEFKVKFIKHLRKMVALNRTNIDEVVLSIEDAVINLNPKEHYQCASFLQKIVYWLVQQSNVRVVDYLCTFEPSQKLVDLVEKINCFI